MTTPPNNLTQPKAGFLSRSYLVAPEHRALKRRLSRFQIMQRYRFQLKLTEVGSRLVCAPHEMPMPR